MKVFLLQGFLLFHRIPACIQFREQHLIQGQEFKFLLGNKAQVKVYLVASNRVHAGWGGVAGHGPKFLFPEGSARRWGRKVFWMYEEIHIAPIHGIPLAESCRVLTQALPLIHGHGSQCFLQVLFLFLFQFLRHSGTGRRYHNSAGDRGKCLGSQHFKDGLAVVMGESAGGCFVELEIVCFACLAPIPADFLGNVKSQVGPFPG